MRPVRSVLGLVMAACVTAQIFGRDDTPAIRTFVVTSQDLPAEFDSARTFHYNFVCSNPESLLTTLWSSDLRVWQAWFPIDDLCMDPVGPRFTVELESGDSAIREFDFSPGDGRLHCATRLKRFIVSE